MAERPRRRQRPRSRGCRRSACSVATMPVASSRRATRTRTTCCTRPSRSRSPSRSASLALLARRARHRHDDLGSAGRPRRRRGRPRARRPRHRARWRRRSSPLASTAARTYLGERSRATPRRYRTGGRVVLHCRVHVRDRLQPARGAHAPGLDFDELEERTKIRAKYLRALEDERFDQLPGHAYVKGFLRTYADSLGLDGQLYVDEYNSRYVAGEDEAPLRAAPPRPPPPARAERRESRVVASRSPRSLCVDGARDRRLALRRPRRPSGRGVYDAAGARAASATKATLRGG